MLLSLYSLVTVFVVGSSLQAWAFTLAFNPHDPFLITGVVKRQNQIVFPPSNGPCLQNAGKEPLACTDPECTDIAGQGLCHIQTQEGTFGHR